MSEASNLTEVTGSTKAPPSHRFPYPPPPTPHSPPSPRDGVLDALDVILGNDRPPHVAGGQAVRRGGVVLQTEGEAVEGEVVEPGGWVGWSVGGSVGGGTRG